MLRVEWSELDFDVVVVKRCSERNVRWCNWGELVRVFPNRVEKTSPEFEGSCIKNSFLEFYLSCCRLLHFSKSAAKQKIRSLNKIVLSL